MTVGQRVGIEHGDGGIPAAIHVNQGPIRGNREPNSARLARNEICSQLGEVLVGGVEVKRQDGVRRAVGCEKKVSDDLKAPEVHGASGIRQAAVHGSRKRGVVWTAYI